MKALRPRVLQVAWRFVCRALVLYLYLPERAWAQTPAPQTLGSMRATGDVYLNGSRAAGEQTLFTGDTVRTGPDGAAALTSPDFGLLIIPAQSEISFTGLSYPATLKQGSVELRSMRAGRNFGIHFGNMFIYLPSTEPEAAGVVTIRADGSVQVSWGLGSVGLRSAQGFELMVLHPNQSIVIDVDGKLRTVESTIPVPTAQTSSGPVAATAKSSRTPYIALAIVAAAGTAATLALILNKTGNQPVSPSSP